MFWFMKSLKVILFNFWTLQVIVFERGDLVFVFNFHPENSYDGYASFDLSKKLFYANGEE